MAEDLRGLIEKFKCTYHDLLWALVIVVGAEIPASPWCVVGQFIELYRQALVKVKILNNDNTASEAAAELA
jgi:hypothetical protein